MQNFSLVIQLVTLEEKRKADKKVKPQHVSLYLSLLMRWRKQKNNPVIRIKSHEMMKEANIGSRRTYYSVMQELVELGFIRQYVGKNDGAIVVMKSFSRNVGVSDNEVDV